MILILISWIYILFTCVNQGFIFDKFFKLSSKNFVIINILGLLSTTILSTIWAIFGRINIEFHIFLMLLNLLIFLFYRNQIILIYKIFYFNLFLLARSFKILLLFITVLIVAQCASAPYLADNESYYIQTIKWINEYGLVKGLVNLHIFLGQTSGWHVAQSAFSFSFLYKNFNDLSGFCLLLGNVFAIQKLDLFFKNGNKNYLKIGIFPIFNLLLFRFISSPSSDIPTYIFTFIVFYLFIKNYKSMTIELFNLISILVLFILFIKTTSAAILLIPIILLIQNFKNFLPKTLPISIFSILILSLYITKNLIITGYPLYPLQYFGTNFDYTIPENMIRFLYESTKLDAYFLSQQQFDSMSNLLLFIRWFTLSKVDMFFDGLTLIILLISPFFIYKYKNEKAVWLVYFVMIFQMFLMIKTSPQYRYFIHFILFFVMVIFSILISNKKIIISSIYLSTFVIVIILFFPINFKSLTTNEFITENDNFKLENIIFPHSNSKSNTAFKTIEKGNLKYNSPIDDNFFWGSFDGNLPAVNHKQIEYFEQYYFVIPQQRSKDLKDGFYVKKIDNRLIDNR